MHLHLSVAEREGRGEAEVGFSAARQAQEGHNAGVQGRLRTQHHGQEAGHVRAV